MKRVTILLMACVLLALFNLANAQNPNVRQTSNKPKAAETQTGKTMLPYKARFSKFALGDARYSAMVLNAWKAWDDNRVDDIADMLADTVAAYLADGTVIKGKEAFINGGKAYRAGFTAVKSEVVAYTSIKLLDAGQRTAVWIWGDEYDTKPDGTTQKMILHEVWRYNNDGKVDLFLQYSRQDLQPATRKADEEALLKADSDWSATATAKNAKAYMNFVIDDVIVMPSNQPMFQGKDAFAKFMEDYFNSPGMVLKWQHTKAEVAKTGDLGYTYGTYTVTQMDSPEKTVIHKGKYTMVWKKQADGTWKVAVDMFSTDLPVK